MAEDPGYAERKQRWRDRKAALGLCTRCGGPPAARGRTKCQECLDRMAARQGAARAAKRAEKANEKGALLLGKGAV